MAKRRKQRRRGAGAVATAPRLTKPQRQEVRAIRRDEGRKAAKQARKGFLAEPAVTPAVQPAPAAPRLSQEQRQEVRATRKSDGKAAARAQRMGFLGVDPNVKLDNAQRKEARKIRKTQGKRAARDYRMEQLLQGSTPPEGPSADAPGAPVADTPQDIPMSEPVAPTPDYRNPYLPYEEVSGRINSAVGTQFDRIMDRPEFAGQNLPQFQTDFGADRRRVEDAMYGRQRELLDDRFGREEESFRQRMADQGIPEGSELFERRYQDFNRAKNDAYESARVSAMQQGSQEQQRQFNQTAQSRNQMFNEQALQYQMPLQQLGAFNPYFQGMTQGQLQNDQQAFQQSTLDQQQAFEQAQLGRTQDFQGNQSRLAFERQKELDAANNAARLGQVRAGRGPQADPFALEALRHQNNLALQNNQFFNQQALQAAQAGNGAPNPSFGGGFGAGLASGAATGAIS